MDMMAAIAPGGPGAHRANTSRPHHSKKPKRILFLTQHRLYPNQRAALERIFGASVQITVDGRAFHDAQEIVRWYREGKYDDLVVIGPVWVLDALMKFSVFPIFTRMERGGKGKPDAFIQFERYEGIKSTPL